MNSFFTSSGSIFRFGVFELQAQERRLLAYGKEIILGARTLDLLLMLVANAGRLVAKEKIFAQLWPNVVVEENNLHVHISVLRKILGADSIATVSGKGYRFTAEVIRTDIVAKEPVIDSKVSGLKILLVDDHVLIRDALRGLINELVGQSEILEAATAQQAQQLIARHFEIDLIVLDLHLPDACGFSLLKSIRASHPHIPVVVVSAKNDRQQVLAVLNEGVQGFIPKATARSVMMQAFNLIFSGGMYIPSEVLTDGNRLVG
jgi:DNA-binding response OmpR family regulator